MRLYRPSAIIRWLYPEALFRVKTKEKILYLTFDDGPHPGSTPFLLDILDRYNIKSVFFCSGKAAERYPELVKKIRSKGHIIGNHGYSHLNGWKTSTKKYCEDVRIAAGHTSDNLFRPPYGRLSIRQYFKLRKSFKIVLWDIMPYDFDTGFAMEKSLGILTRMIRPGSVIVLHDTPASSSTKLLGELLDLAISKNYRFGIQEFHG